MTTITGGTRATITTTKGTHTGTVASCVEWQREIQGAFAAIEIGGESHDVSHIDYGADDLVADISETIASLGVK